MNILKQINLYVGKECKNDIDYKLIDHSDGNGIQFEFWNIADKPQPTIVELKTLQPQIEAQEKGEAILAKIIELDSKRSRAFFEPSEKEPNLTWLDYYNQEILKLRTQLSSIQST